MRQQMFDKLIINNEAKSVLAAYDKANIDVLDFNKEVRLIKNKFLDLHKKIKVPDNYILYKIIPSEFEFNIPSDVNVFNLTIVMYLKNNKWNIRKHKQSNCIYTK